MNDLASDVRFKNSLFLVKQGVPWNVVFGNSDKQWPRLWLDSAAMILVEMRDPNAFTGE